MIGTPGRSNALAIAERLGMPREVLEVARGYVAPPDCFVAKLYSMLGAVDRILTEHQIPYWMETGTLLGAVRHRGMIPWDDDVDIGVPQAFDDRLLGLAGELERAGLVLHRYSCGWKIGFIGDPNEADRFEHWWYKIVRWFRGSSYPYVDVISKREDDAGVRKPQRTQQRYRDDQEQQQAKSALRW